MLKIGDKVKFNHKYCHSIQAPPEITEMEGEVKECRSLKPGLQYVKVLWKGEEELKGALSSNLARIKDGLLIDPTE